MAQPKQTWDTRAWLLGIVGGSVSGGISAWSNYPPIQRRIDAMPHPAFVGPLSADVISPLFGLLSLLVLPGVLSGLSRRLTFLWGSVPLGLFLALMNTEEWCENGIKSAGKDWWINLVVLGICLTASSGPVSLLRWLRVRGKRRQAALLASHQAMREAASIPQEGVWPPPPNYTA